MNNISGTIFINKLKKLNIITTTTISIDVILTYFSNQTEYQQKNLIQISLKNFQLKN